MAEKFPNLWSDLDIQVHEASRSPQNFNPEWYSSRHIITELSKIKTKERMLKAEKWNIFLTQSNLSAAKATCRFLSRNFAGRYRMHALTEKLHRIQSTERERLPPRILRPEKSSFRNESSTDKLKEFRTL